MRKPLAHYNEFMNYVWRTWKMLKGKSNPWLSCPRFPLPIPSRGKFRKHWGPRLNQKQILQKNPRRGQRSQYLKLSHQHQLVFQEKRGKKKQQKDAWIWILNSLNFELFVKYTLLVESERLYFGVAPHIFQIICFTNMSGKGEL